MSDPLFQPLTVGDLELPNRVVMSPLTRCRASEGRVPNALNAEYYRQRAGAGLIITEATSIRPDGVGYPDTPGIWSEEQIAGWKLVTDAVHASGGRIVLQLWHVGRMSDPFYLDGEQPIAPSAVTPEGHVPLIRPEKDYEAPRAMTLDEVRQVVADFRQGAENAKAAGFDGVELHGANGYLIDQFMQDSTNLRTDEYGGSIENRCRLLMEVVDELIDVWGAGRVGVHLSPGCDIHSMGDSDPQALFLYAAEKLGEKNIAFLCTREAYGPEALSARMKQAFGGVLFGNMGYTAETARERIDAGEADAIAFGTLYICNPDLAERFAQDAELNEPRPDTFVTYDEPSQGYTDYPSLAGVAG